MGRGGDSVGTKRVEAVSLATSPASSRMSTRTSNSNSNSNSNSAAREALKFFFSDEGALFREFLLDEVCDGVDALSREAARELFISIVRTP